MQAEAGFAEKLPTFMPVYFLLELTKVDFKQGLGGHHCLIKSILSLHILDLKL